MQIRPRSTAAAARNRNADNNAPRKLTDWMVGFGRGCKEAKPTHCAYKRQRRSKKRTPSIRRALNTKSADAPIHRQHRSANAKADDETKRLNNNTNERANTKGAATTNPNSDWCAAAATTTT